MRTSLFAGVFAAFAVSWFGVVMIPQAQLGGLQPQVDEIARTAYPVNVGGVAAQGRQVYASLGCVYCHSQQVRSDFNGSDLERGWGQGASPTKRRTVARDYIYDSPTFLGTTRVGPDLANIGFRQPNAQWHYLHLYNPRATSPGSNMPPFRFLFEKRKISGERSMDALTLWGEDALEPGWEVVPKGEARSLVAYLLTLDRTGELGESAGPLKEAPAAAEEPKKEAAK